MIDLKNIKIVCDDTLNWFGVYENDELYYEDEGSNIDFFDALRILNIPTNQFLVEMEEGNLPNDFSELNIIEELESV